MSKHRTAKERRKRREKLQSLWERLWLPTKVEIEAAWAKALDKALR
jgi:hypothetical protein